MSNFITNNDAKDLKKRVEGLYAKSNGPRVEIDADRRKKYCVNGNQNANS